MSDFFKRMENGIAYEKVGRGEGTGPISRILSGINILILVFILTYLFKDHKYIPLGILLVSFFTSFGHWIGMGVIIYFVITRYWSGAFLLSLYVIISFFWVWFGMRSIKRNLYSGRASVDPFEGMHDLLPIFIIQVLSFGIALITNGILSIVFWVIFALVTIYEVGRYYVRLASPWRRIHFPLMVRYSSIAGYQMGTAERTGKEFSIKDVLHTLVKSAYPYMEDYQADSLIKSAQEKMYNFSDKEALKKLFHKSKHSIDDNKLQELMDKIETALKNPQEKGLLVRYIIGEIIGKDYGEQERLKYIHAVITGQAN
ncbi:MAG: hypothetical protein WA104_06120 [Thermodesulfovibrionales bacterium]